MFLFDRLPASLLGFIALSMLTSCGNSAAYLETLQTQIQADIVKQGGNSLKSVVCLPPNGEKPLECTGTLESGSGFDIPVEQKEDKSYSWNIPSVKGLLNMLQIQTAIKAGLQSEVGEVSLDCGGDQTYRSAKPGESFECQLKKDQSSTTATAKTPPTDAKDPKDAKDSKDAKDAGKTPAQPEKVVVTIMPSGDISWQRTLPLNAKLGDTKSGDLKSGDLKSGDPKSGSKDAKSPIETPKKPDAAEGSTPTASPTGQPAPAAAKSADDFLNQSGATDDF
jgi:hypothetical protein